MQQKSMIRTVAGLLPLMALVMLSLMCGCSEKPKYRIGVSQCSGDDWRNKLNDEIEREALISDNIEIEIRSADDNSEKQKDDLRYFANNGFDAIIASPNEVSAVTPVLDSIYEAGIPLIIFDRRTNTDRHTAFQGADNREIGRTAAKYAMTLVPEARIIEIKGNLETSPAIDRHIGFKEYAETTPGMQIIAEADGLWLDDRAAFLADSMLRAHPEANVIYAHNDRMAIAAAKAARALNRTDLHILGIDASPEIGIRAVADTVIDATFIYPTAGRQLVKTAIAILEGKPYERNLIIPTRTAVDLNNAEILLVQNDALKEETANIHELKSHLNTFIKQYSTQKAFLYAVMVIVLLLVITIFVMMRSFWMQRRNREEIERQNELLRRQRDEVQQATQSKLSFFTNVSHDLRTPLTLIAEPIEQLREAGNLTQSQAKMVNLAAKNVRILSRLVNQIIDLRKYENARLDLNLNEVNLAAEVRDWTEAFHVAANRKHLKFKVELPEDTDNYFLAVDVDKVERILFNLIANAFKFTPENGTVKVALSRSSNEVTLQVSDNGKGISPDDLSRVFDRFFKADKVSPQGSGIGLALSKAFAELHGGSLSAESIEGQGSTFTLRIPITHIEQQATSAPHKEDEKPDSRDTVTELSDIEPDDPEPNESETTILVIDDNPDLCTLIETLLGDKFRILRAKDGAEGIRRASRHIPDLIICDVMMPGISGFETCKRLKSEITTSHIPVLLLTACGTDEQRADGYECGADGYLTKPFSGSLLIARVNSLLENRNRIMQLYADKHQTVADIKEDGREKRKTVGTIDNEFYIRFRTLVEQRMGDSDMSIDEISAAMGVSRVQLYRKLKSITNYSPTDLIRNLRLQRASTLLKTTDITIAEAGYAVGFSSHSYFTKCFREYFGESPSEVQKRTSKFTDQ